MLSLFLGGFAHLFPLVQVRQGRAGGLLVLVPALHIDRGEAGELQALVAGPEQVGVAAYVNGDGVVHRVGHLAGQEPAPDQPVELILLGGEALAHVLRGQVDIGGADGLVGVLGVGPGLVRPGFFRNIGAAVSLADIAPGGVRRLLGQAQGVGTHIGDQTHGAHAGDVHTLIQLLGHGHGSPGLHIQLPAGLLLQGRGGKGRSGLALLFRLPHAVHHKGIMIGVCDNGVHCALAVQLGLFPALAVVVGHKGAHPGVYAVQLDVQRPVLLGDEGPDLPLPLHHQAGGHRLHAACGQAPANFFPQQGGELVAHNAVQNPPGLLGVHQVLVDAPGRSDGLLHHRLGDLVEGHPVGALLRQRQQLLQVPGNGLALPVRVGGQVHMVAALDSPLQLLNDVFFALDGLVAWFKIVFQIYAQLAFGQIPDVAHGCDHGVIGAKITADRFCFCR